MKAPIGYFVHHQGRGHAERCAALVNALPADRPVTVFSARDDIFPTLRPGVRVLRIPSLFEPSGAEIPGLDHIPTPETLHCAPLGWPGIRTAMATIAGWFAETAPALMICDVSAEIAQLARICSVPHVAVLQHGDRSDPGHRAAYDGAAGILAPFHADLAQPDWDAVMRARMMFAPGLGCPEAPIPDRIEARARLGIAAEAEVVLVISGAGGDGFAAAPLGVGARAFPQAGWITAGRIARDWHATEPSNLQHLGWVDGIADHIGAADLIVASTGNTTCQQILAAGRPWIAVPEWRYFDEQVFKARALQDAGAAWHCPALPSSARAWRHAVEAARAMHDPARQRSLAGNGGASRAAGWIEDLADRLSSAPRAENIIPIPVTS
ncbi:glycosyltransferase [Cereibacter sp. SYSU M97828]|nr:glycosyltransferase [Cereibacter flavus]